MSFKSLAWEIYKEQMSQLGHGDAMWEPAPIHSFKRIQLGDVGYVRRGRFHLLFSAGRPLGERRLGADVPLTFESLNVGPTIYGQPRLPGYLCTRTVRKIGAGLRASMAAVPMLEHGVSISLELTEKRGGALITKYRTYREDVELESVFKAYTKRHYDSWVAFACAAGHGDDIKPVLVTGVDMTRDFAMMAYLNNGDSLRSEFTTSVPTPASAWGTWRTEGLVHTNCGPQMCCPPSSTQTTDPTPSDNNDVETVPEEYNQCVFIRYYTMRKRGLMFPRVMRAAAGPHDLGPGGHDDEELPEVEAQSDSDSDSDTMSGFGDDDRSSVTSMDSESDVVIHNVASDECDDFDILADYVFQNSDAESVLIHHRDITLLRESGGDTDLRTLLFQERPSITVDGSGVGTIEDQTNPARESLQSDHISDDQGSDILVPGGYAVSSAQMSLPTAVHEASLDSTPREFSTSAMDDRTSTWFLPLIDDTIMIRTRLQTGESMLLQEEPVTPLGVLGDIRDIPTDVDAQGNLPDNSQDITGWIHGVAEACDSRSNSHEADEGNARNIHPSPNARTSPPLMPKTYLDPAPPIPSASNAWLFASWLLLFPLLYACICIPQRLSTCVQQDVGSWLLPWLALVSQVPFGSGRNYKDDLHSVVLCVGSPALVVCSLALTSLKVRSFYRKAHRVKKSSENSVDRCYEAKARTLTAAIQGIYKDKPPLDPTVPAFSRYTRAFTWRTLTGPSVPIRGVTSKPTGGRTFPEREWGLTRTHYVLILALILQYGAAAVAVVFNPAVGLGRCLRECVIFNGIVAVTTSIGVMVISATRVLLSEHLPNEQSPMVKGSMTFFDITPRRAALLALIAATGLIVISHFNDFYFEANVIGRGACSYIVVILGGWISTMKDSHIVGTTLSAAGMVISTIFLAFTSASPPGYWFSGGKRTCCYNFVFIGLAAITFLYTIR